MSALTDYLDNLANLVGGWNLASLAGDDPDVSGNGNDAVITVGEGSRGAAAIEAGGTLSLYYDGEDTAADVEDDAAIQDIWASGGTLFVLLDADSGGEGSGHIVYKRSTIGWQLFFNSGQAFPRFVVTFGNSDASWVTSNFAFGTQYALVVTYDASSTSNDPAYHLLNIDTETAVKLTVGSGLIEQIAPSGAYEGDAGADLHIGSTGSGALTFDGRLSVVRLYSRVLSDSEINQAFDYVLGAPPPPSGDGAIEAIAETEAVGASHRIGEAATEAIADVSATGTANRFGDAAVEAIAEVEAAGSSASGDPVFEAIAEVEATGESAREGDAEVEVIATVQATGSPALDKPGIPAPPVATPTAAQVADALSGIQFGHGAPVPLRFRYSRRTRTNGFIDEITGIATPGTVSLDNTRPVVRDLTVDFYADQLPTDFNPSSDIIGVAVEVYVAEVGQWASIPVGLFTLDVARSRFRGQHELISAKGADLTMLLLRSVRTAAYTVKAGTNYVQAVRTIIERHGLAHTIPDDSATAPHDYTWGPGANDLQIANELLFGINFYPLWADATGRCRSRERIDPSTETVAVTYKDTSEPRMVREEYDYERGIDRKRTNRAVVVIDDPRNSDYGYVQRENADPDAPNSTASLSYGTAVDVSSSSVDSPTVITTDSAHGFSTGVQVLISGHEGSTPDINGSHIIDALSDTTFSIPIEVTVAGSGGTAQATTVQLQGGEFNGDSQPPTKAVPSAVQAAEIAEFELRWAALMAQQATLPTFIDPRRGAHEFYAVDLAGIEETQLFGVIGWRMTLKPGEVMQHTVGRANPVELLSPPKL